jgi:SpoVK/Ycf46/Vps4 family AAA+-type ATPase
MGGWYAARSLSPCIVLLDNLDMLLGGAAPATAQSKPEDGPSLLPRSAGGEAISSSSSVAAATLATDGFNDSNKHSSDAAALAKAKGRLPGINRTRKFVPRSTRTRHQAVDRMLSTLLVEIDGVYSGQAPEAFKDTLGTQFKVRLR